MTTTLPKPTEMELAPRPFHWTVEAFYRAADAGVFPEGKRIELVRGELIEKMPPSPLHSNKIDSMARLLRRALEPRYRIREEKPIHIAFNGEPIPDISVVQPIDYANRHPHPKDVVLIVGIAISSAAGDTVEKALLYAQAGITDYWVALPETQTLLVYREPSETGYQSVTTLKGDATITALAAPEATFAIANLFGEAGERVQPS